MIYNYNFTKPMFNLWLFHDDVSNSLMTNKSIDFCKHANSILEINFIQELSVDDKVKLDTIVNNRSEEL